MRDHDACRGANHDAHDPSPTDRSAPDALARILGGDEPSREARHDAFWRAYASVACPAIEGACRRASRSLSDSTMPVEDMIGWVDERVWRLLRRAQAPIFHDLPEPEVAARRVAEFAPVLARWAYLALSRRHWRRLAREDALGEMTERVETLGSARAGADFERTEQIEHDLAALREALPQRVRRNLAASWPEGDERARVAIALGATAPEDDDAIDRVARGDVKRNAVEQMRSRARKAARDAAEAIAAARPVLLLLASVGMLALSAAGAIAGGEQTGGGRGGADMDAARIAHLDDASPNPLRCNGGEQTGGGRGG